MMPGYFIGPSHAYGKKPQKFGKKNFILELQIGVQDIDTYDDWKKAEIIYKY